MVDGLFFCAILTGRRGGHTPFVQAEAETSDTSAEVVKPDQTQAVLGRLIPEASGGDGDESAESCKVVRPLHVPRVIRPVRRTDVAIVR